MPSAYVVFYFSAANTPTQVIIGTKHVGCPNNGGQRAFPGGRANPGENLLDAARREAVEETGLQIGPWPEGGPPNGVLAGQPYTCSGRQFDGFYVAYIRIATAHGLTQIALSANNNLPHIPGQQREFTGFQVVSQEDAVQAFVEDDDPTNPRRRTDWFRTAVTNIP
jgi:8-oxo-dGTP pyrophosphatase MutT (NUDIX family)